MVKMSKKGSLIGSVGGILVGAAMLLFIVTIILGALKANGGSTDAVGSAPSEPGLTARASWNTTNATVDTLSSFLTIGVVLLGVLGITMIGATIIGYISGAFSG
jgi:hypothetical protein